MTKEEAELLGFSWSDFGKDVFGGVHIAGRVLATAFAGQAGASLADSAESLESQGGLLPDWARSNTKGQAPAAAPEPGAASPSPAGPPSVTVMAPQYVVVQHTNGKTDPPLAIGTMVTVTGGTRFDGNGYRPGEPFGKRFSFGYLAPAKVEIQQRGPVGKVAFTDVRQVVFCGGTESTNTRVAGLERSDPMTMKKLGDEILGDLAEANAWTEIVGGVHPVSVQKSTYVHGIDVCGASMSTPAQSMGRMITQAAKSGQRAVVSQPSNAVTTLTQGKPPKSGFSVSKSPLKGRAHIVQHVAPASKHRATNAESIRLARQVSARTQKHAQQILKKLAQDKKARMTPVVGALARPRIISHPHLSPAEIKKIAQDALKTSKALSTNADKHQSTVSNYTTRQRSGLDATRRAYGPRGQKGVRVTGIEDFDILGVLSDYDIVGAPTDPDPTNPGYLIDGSPDPNYDPSTGSSSYTDPSSVPDSGTGDSGVPGPPDYGVPVPDQTAGQLQLGEYAPDPMGPGGVGDQNVYAFPGSGADGLPEGAILYDKTTMKPWGWQAVGSFTRFNPSGDTSNGHGNSGFQWGGGDASIMDGWYWWWHGATSGTEYKHDTGPQPTGANYPPYSQALAGTPDAPARAQASIQCGWGPLIGNPADPDFHSIRYDMQGDRWFFFYDSAPAWAKAPGDMVRYNQALLDYNTQLTAAKANYADEVAQDALAQKQAADAARTNAAEDAAAQHQADIAAIQQQTQQTQMDQQFQQQQQQYEAQQGQYDLQERKQALDYYGQHPDELYQAGSPADDGSDQGDGGPVDDGSQQSEDRNYIDQGRGDGGGSDDLSDTGDSVDDINTMMDEA